MGATAQESPPVALPASYGLRISQNFMDRLPMRAFAKIVVEGSAEHWTAWFRDAPQIAMSADWPSAAIERLLEHFGEENFDSETIVAIHEESRDGHLVFMVGLRERIRIPVPSVN